MKKLNNEELMTIYGGSAFLKFLKNGAYGLIAGCVLIASVIYGYIHPTACNK